MKSIVVIFAFACTLTLLVACSGEQTQPSSQTDDEDSLFLPDTDISGAAISMYQRDQVTAEIVAERITRFDEIDSTMGYVLDIDLYDSTGQIVSKLVGDSGLIREESNELHVYGNVVVVVTKNDTELKTDSLYYDPLSAHIKTDDFVEITRGESVVTGWGLDADRQLDTLRILRMVSGSIKDIPPEP